MIPAAGCPTKAQFVKVYGQKGPAMNWEQRAAAGVPAEKFQEMLKAKLANSNKLGVNREDEIFVVNCGACVVIRSDSSTR